MKRRIDRLVPAWALAAPVLLLLALLVLSPGSLSAQACDTDTDCLGNGTALDIALGMPVPDVNPNDPPPTIQDEMWVHAGGSTAHCNPTTPFFGDCWAMDFNLNPPNLHNLDEDMPVLAADDGTVSQVTFDGGGYGNIVRIDHTQNGEDFLTLYAHMHDAVMVVEGQQVRRGQVLGFISNTGAPAAHHLHFAIRTDANGAGYTLDLDGQSMEDVPLGDEYYLSSSNQYFLEELEGATSGWEAGLAFDGAGFADLPTGTNVLDFQHMMTVRDGKGPYLFEYAAQLEPATGGDNLRLVLGAYDWQVMAQRTSLGFVYPPFSTTDTAGGWEAVSFLRSHSQLPTGTRFLRPALATVLGGAARLDYVRMEEGPAAAVGGDIRLRAHNRGGETRISWSASDLFGVTGFRVLRSQLKDGPATEVASVAPAGSDYRLDDPITSGQSYYYTLELTTVGGAVRRVGPIGPVETFTVADVPGLGVSRIYSNFRDVPDWAGYPDLSFDLDTTTYGLINFAPSQVRVLIEPLAVPFTFSELNAYFGGTLNQVTGRLRSWPDGSMVSLGTATNQANQWLTFGPPPLAPDLFDQVELTMQRLDGDRFFHNAEVQLNADPQVCCIPEICDGQDNDGDGQVDEENVCGCVTATSAGSEYRFCDARVSWYEARDACAAMGSALVKIDDAAENSWVAAQASPHDRWLGLSDAAVEGSWRWLDGSDPGANVFWSTYEPNGWTRENCAMMWTGGSWNDLPCAWDNSFVCERSLVGEEACVKLDLTYYNSNNCVSGPVDHDVDLYEVDTNQLVGQLELGLDGRHCATLRRGVLYAIREDNVPASACGQGYTVFCYTSLELTDPDASGTCGDANPDCEELGDVDFYCGS